MVKAKKTKVIEEVKANESSGNLEDCIRKKAYELWEQKGRLSGKDLENWLEAEKIIKSGKKR
jgi:hypothetical protein